LVKLASCLGSAARRGAGWAIWAELSFRESQVEVGRGWTGPRWLGCLTKTCLLASAELNGDS
jgi:hypothetical protein